MSLVPMCTPGDPGDPDVLTGFAYAIEECSSGDVEIRYVNLAGTITTSLPSGWILCGTSATTGGSTISLDTGNCTTNYLSLAGGVLAFDAPWSTSSPSGVLQDDWGSADLSRFRSLFVRDAGDCVLEVLAEADIQALQLELPSGQVSTGYFPTHGNPSATTAQRVDHVSVPTPYTGISAFQLNVDLYGLTGNLATNVVLNFRGNATATAAPGILATITINSGSAPDANGHIRAETSFAAFTLPNGGVYQWQLQTVPAGVVAVKAELLHINVK